MTAAVGRDAAVALWLLPAVYFVFVGAEFALMTHLAIDFTAAGRPAWQVGALGTALWSGILLAALAAHRAVARAGSARVLVGGVALALGATLGVALTDGPLAWSAGAAVMGLGSGLVWVAGESWLAEAAPPDRRGLLVGWFETAVGLGMMVGPALVPLARLFAWPLPALCAGLMTLALAAVGTLWAAGLAPPVANAADAGAHAGPGLAPLLGVALLGGVMESGVSALLPSVAMRIGFGADAAALLGTVIGAGSALLQPPAGHLADRCGTRPALLAAWAIVCATTLALAAHGDAASGLLWVAGFVMGGAGGAVYTLVVVEFGQRLRGAALVRAVGALVIAYAAGTALGPVAGGALFDVAGLRGLALALALLAAGGFVWTAARLTESPR